MYTLSDAIPYLSGRLPEEKLGIAYWVIAALSLLAVILYAFYRSRLDRQEALIRQKQQENERQAEAFASLTTRHQQQQQELHRITFLYEQAERKLQALEKMKDYEEKFHTLHISVLRLRQELVTLRQERLYHSAIGCRLRELAQSRQPESSRQQVTKEEWAALETEVLAIYPSLKTKLLKRGLTAGDCRHCYLTLLQLELKEIAVLLRIHTESVNKQRHRTKLALGLSGKANNLYDYLLEG